MSILEKDGAERMAVSELLQEVNRATEKAAIPEAPGNTAASVGSTDTKLGGS